MSYLVLARKWRPRDFESLVGQEHVVRALTHALTTQRLHHAWLFTGTRGVGKTTLSRILAKSLNCEKGITAKPCGQCTACVQIDAGRFVDYVELDAASNRGVEEMTQLLEQAVYAPTAARFKIYMIDEVHMLTGHAFNAMLKTLEEPPPHVKFILATTDPQKILPTVLSRCLQFNLKQMAPDAIANHLAYVLEQEKVKFEPAALRLIGQAAAGSMRDALSLTDQAIAYSAGDLTVSAVRSMLGTVDQTLLVQLLQMLCLGDAQGVVKIASSLSERGLSLRSALSDLAVMLSKIAILQRVGSCELEDEMLQGVLQELAGQMPPDLVQLFYTVAVHSRQELTLAPDEYAGFIMVCLRMLGFVDSLAPDQKKSLKFSQVVSQAESAQEDSQPLSMSQVATSHAEVASGSQEPADGVDKSASHDLQNPQDNAALAAHEQNDGTPLQSVASDETQVEPTGDLSSVSGQQVDDIVPPWEDVPDPALDQDVMFDGEPSPEKLQEYISSGYSDQDVEESGATGQDPSGLDQQPTPKQSLQSLVRDWPQIAAGLAVTGMARQLAMQSVCVTASQDGIVLRVGASALAQGPHVQRLKQACCDLLGQDVDLRIEVGDLGSHMSAQQLADQQAQQQIERAQQILEQDPFVKTLMNEMGARIVPGSVRS